jgi:hypothetical protein
VLHFSGEEAGSGVHIRIVARRDWKVAVGSNDSSRENSRSQKTPMTVFLINDGVLSAFAGLGCRG